MAERMTKLTTIDQAVAQIPDGSRIVLGGFSVYQRPMAAVHALIRAGKKDLTIIGVINSIETDMLIGAGAVRKVETSYVGLERFGLAGNFRRAMQSGRLEVEYYSEMMAWDRHRADREGMEFWPATYLNGTDLIKTNPSLKSITSPFSGREIWLVPAANADYAIIHAYAGDKYGNLQHQERIGLPQSVDFDSARGAKKVIATVEHLLDEVTVQEHVDRTIIPAFKTTALAHIPNGAHPTQTLDSTVIDGAFFREYAEASKSEDTFRAFLDRYIYGTANFEEYLALANRLGR